MNTNNPVLEQVCIHALALTDLARRDANVTLPSCAFSDFKAAVASMGPDALTKQKLWAVLELNGFTTLASLTMAQKSRWQEILGNSWGNGNTAVVGILPCDNNGTPFTAEQITNGEHIMILRVNPQTHRTIGGEGFPALIPEPLWSAGLFKVEITLEPNNINFATLESVENFLQQVIRHFEQVSNLLK